jgi:hypothetical protein
LLRSKTVTLKMPENNWRELNTSRTSDVRRKSRMSKLFSILQYWFYNNNNTFWVTFSYSISRFILLFPVWKLWATESPTIIQTHHVWS